MLRTRLAVAVLALAAVSLAQAQAWPTKPVRIVIAFALAGATDVVVRSVADPVSQSTAKRAASLPDVPTYREQGVDLEIGQWLAVFAPAGTPREAVVRLNAEMAKALAMLVVQARYAAAALEPVGGSPEQLGAVLTRDFEKFGRLTKELTLRVD